MGVGGGAVGGVSRKNHPEPARTSTLLSRLLPIPPSSLLLIVTVFYVVLTPPQALFPIPSVWRQGALLFPFYR